MIKNRRYAQSGFSITEYAIVFGIVSVTLVSMQIYMKRGLQGRVKSMSDTLLAGQDEHTGSRSKTTFMDATTNTQATSASQLLGFLGGGRQVSTRESTNSVSTTNVYDSQLYEGTKDEE